MIVILMYQPLCLCELSNSISHFILRWQHLQMYTIIYIHMYSQICVTFQGNSEIGQHKTGGHLIQV